MKLGSIDTQKIIDGLIKHRVIIAWLLVLVLLGFTLWQAVEITEQQVDSNYLEELREEAEQDGVTLDLEEELRDEIEDLESGAIDIGLDGRGERDPFNP